MAGDGPGACTPTISIFIPSCFTSTSVSNSLETLMSGLNMRSSHGLLDEARLNTAVSFGYRYWEYANLDTICLPPVSPSGSLHAGYSKEPYCNPLMTSPSNAYHFAPKSNQRRHVSSHRDLIRPGLQYLTESGFSTNCQYLNCQWYELVCVVSG
ncbi:hypothetical protein EDB19DRAFT_286624 [Suillus lakei]|nr:hypothetical protein EDB19DRAFT_286624 [Suillus lakei]